MPQQVAGLRIEPPVSVPSAAGAKPARQRRARAARRAAGMQIAVPGIARRRPGQVERRPAGRELVQRELAEQDRAGVAQLAAITKASAAARGRMRIFEWQVVAMPSTSKMSFAA